MKPRRRLWARWRRRSATNPPSPLVADVVAEPSHAAWLAQLLYDLRAPAGADAAFRRADLDQAIRRGQAVAHQFLPRPS